MKKGLILLSGILLLLTGCGGQQPQETAEKVYSEEIVQDKEQSTDAVTPKPAKSETAPDSEESKADNSLQEERPDDQLEQEEEPSFKEIPRDEAAWAARLEVEKAFVSDFAVLKEKAEALLAERPELFTEKISYYDSVIARMDERVISFSSGHQFDAVTGAELQISDIFTDEEKFWDIVKYRLLSCIEEEIRRESDKFYGENYVEMIAEMEHHPENFIWTMEGTGIRFYFKPETVKAYSIEYTVPYVELATSMKPEYLPGTGALIGKLSCNCEMEAEEGITFCLEAEQLESNGYASGVSLRVNETEYVLDEEGYNFFYGYVMKRPDGRTFLILCMDYVSDDYNTVVMEITGGVIRKCSNYSGASFLLEPGNFEAINLDVFLSVLGYRYSSQECILTEDGQIEPLSDNYTISGSLTVVNQELPVVIEGEQVLLPVGTEIDIQSTDGKSMVTFTLKETGQTGEIHFDEKDEDIWSFNTINGLEESEYFEDLHYAG